MQKRSALTRLACWSLIIASSVTAATAQQSTEFLSKIPRTWDEGELSSMLLPLANPAATPEQISADYYYRMRVRPIYKSYPIYHPSKEPAGYFDWLREREPEVVFDPSQLNTEADWISAGKLVFEAPLSYIDTSRHRSLAWYEATRTPIAREGVMPFLRYFVRKKGVVEVGTGSCASCHTRVLPDGSVVDGAQGNFPFHAGLQAGRRVGQQLPSREARLKTELGMRGAPWLGDKSPAKLLNELTDSEMEVLIAHPPPGVVARHGTSYFSPAQVPDLIGVRERRYLDHTGLARHRSAADLMRYAATNQDTDMLAQYVDGFIPAGTRPAPETLERYSDEQLYALTLYVYSLKPPPNPNKPTPLSQRGAKIFEREGCAGCHTPPIYTNNKLTLAIGFQPSVAVRKANDILPTSVKTDPGLSLYTRRGTGFYKVPSLKGLWYRGPLEHSGSVATLEDWFDPTRLLDSFVPTGFRGVKTTRAVKGHEFGLQLSETEKAALIAFLRTL
jgi:hypothetical protein